MHKICVLRHFCFLMSCCPVFDYPLTDELFRAAVSILPLRCFLFLLPNYIHVYANTCTMQQFLYLDKREVLQQEYPQPLILPSSHFRWVVKLHYWRDNIFSIEITMTSLILLQMHASMEQFTCAYFIAG